jgi:Leucine-rich repeat (LRR) protein
MDIQRHLHDEAVTACPPGQLYKLQKLVRRNKLACTAAACVMLALVAGLAASLWQAGRAEREATRAQSEAGRAAHEAQRARSAEHQAVATLDELRATAPTFAADAKTLAAKGQFELAIEKLDYAAKLQPDAPDIPVTKGDIYLCQLKFPEAAACYRDALRRKPGFAPAEMKAKLCDQLLAAPRSAQDKLSLESLVKVYSALEPNKRSATELKAVSEACANEKERLWKYWLPRLQSLPMFAKSGFYTNLTNVSRFSIRDDGQLSLFLGDMDFSDLSQLKDLPIADLSIIRCKNVTDVQVLAEMPSLENVTIPVMARHIEALHKLPKLKRLSFSETQRMFSKLHMNLWAFNVVPDTTAEEFWKEFANLSWLSRLRDSDIKPNEISRRADGTWDVTVHDPKFADCSIFKGSKVRRLDLWGSSVADLSPLADVPLESLDVRETPVADLSPLRSPALRDSLRELRVWRTKVTDFSPVAGCTKLQVFDAADTALSDLSIVKGTKLHSLLIERTAVADLAPVAGMPLEDVAIGGTRVTDLSPLLKCATLRNVILPDNAKNVESLHGLPNLARLSYTSPGAGYPDKSADEFWKEHDPSDWRSTFRKSGFKAEWMRQTADGTWDVGLDRAGITDLSFLHGAPISRLSLGGNEITDLAPLRGMPLKHLVLSGTKVTDLSPLKGMQLELLWLDGTAVKDLSPLHGMPLIWLKLHGCPNVTDLSPIGDAKELSELILPPNAKDFEFLRKFPKLQRLSFDEDQSSFRTDKTAGEFWKKYDRTKSAATP